MIRLLFKILTVQPVFLIKGDRNWLTVGAKYELGNDWTVDAAYGYMFASKVKIDESNYADDGQPASDYRLEGEYDNTAHVFSASVTKRF